MAFFSIKTQLKLFKALICTMSILYPTIYKQFYRKFRLSFFLEEMENPYAISAFL